MNKGSLRDKESEVVRGSLNGFDKLQVRIEQLEVALMLLLMELQRRRITLGEDLLTGGLSDELFDKLHNLIQGKE